MWEIEFFIKLNLLSFENLTKNIFHEMFEQRYVRQSKMVHLYIKRERERKRILAFRTFFICIYKLLCLSIYLVC